MKVTKDILSIYEEILTNNKSILNELELIKLSTTNYSNLKFDTDGTQNDEVNKALLDDINNAAKSAGIIATITTASSGHSEKTITGNQSRHPQKTAVDIAILDGIGSENATNSTNGSSKFRTLGNKLKDALVTMGYTLNSESGNNKAVLWQTNIGGNHYNHLHISNNSGESATTQQSQQSQQDDGDSFWNVSGVEKDTFMGDYVSRIAKRFLPENSQQVKEFNQSNGKLKRKKVTENIERNKKLL
jgi:hypothetical protein